MLKTLPIIIHPNPLLKKKSIKIDEKEINTEEFQKLCVNLAKTMEQRGGIGLSCPQIGKNIRLIVINVKNEPLYIINPKITKKSWFKEWEEEGCLSLPGIYGKVKRHKKIKCSYLDRDGKKIKIKAKGLMARVIQHEIDHLDGILFIDKARDVKHCK